VRLVTDTNIVVSGLLWDGAPARLIDAAEDFKIEIVTSHALLAELWAVVSRRKFDGQLAKRGTSARAVFDGYARLATLVHATHVERVIARDPADDEVLAAALAGNADLIVSGDAHLLDLGRYRGIEIVRAGEAVARIGDAPGVGAPSGI
jgi:uncharacterized protein